MSLNHFNKRHFAELVTRWGEYFLRPQLLFVYFSVYFSIPSLAVFLDDTVGDVARSVFCSNWCGCLFSFLPSVTFPRSITPFSHPSQPTNNKPHRPFLFFSPSLFIVVGRHFGGAVFVCFSPCSSEECHFTQRTVRSPPRRRQQRLAPLAARPQRIAMPTIEVKSPQEP